MTPSALLSLLLLAGSPPPASSTGAVSGDYVEVRSNHVYTCGCLYSGELVTTGTEAILAWNIRAGERAGTPLESFRAVAVTVGAETLSIGNPRKRTVLYVDEASSRKQQEAGLSFLREQYSDVFGDVIAVHTAPIDFRKDAGRTAVHIPEVASLVLRGSRLDEDAHLGSFQWFDPFVPLENAELRTVVHEEYRADDFSRRWRRNRPGIRGFTGEFAVPR